jgi:hypothetical protein
MYMYVYVCINDLRSIVILEYAYVRTLFFLVKDRKYTASLLMFSGNVCMYVCMYVCMHVCSV